MESLASFFSASGRIGAKPFAIGVAIVYLVAFLSQFLLAAPMMARGGMIAYGALQALITWNWYALHAKRLRDTGRPITPAVALAVLYALAIPLFLLVIVAVMTPAATMAPAAGGAPPAPGAVDFILLFFLIGLIVGGPAMGIFGFIILLVLLLVMLPLLIALGFSIWLATRPSVAPPLPS